jgi:hypothetical protein
MWYNLITNCEAQCAHSRHTVHVMHWVCILQRATTQVVPVIAGTTFKLKHLLVLLVGADQPVATCPFGTTRSFSVTVMSLLFCTAESLLLFRTGECCGIAIHY